MPDLLQGFQPAQVDFLPSMVQDNGLSTKEALTQQGGEASLREIIVVDREA